MFQLDYKSIRYYLRVVPRGRLATVIAMENYELKGLERLKLDQDAFWKSLAAVHKSTIYVRFVPPVLHSDCCTRTVAPNLLS